MSAVLLEKKSISVENMIETYLRDKGWSGILDGIWTAGEELHIYIVDGDWKHQHLDCQILLGSIGYDQVAEIEEPSDDDCYTSEHVFIKR